MDAFPQKLVYDSLNGIKLPKSVAYFHSNLYMKHHLLNGTTYLATLCGFEIYVAKVAHIDKLVGIQLDQKIPVETKKIAYDKDAPITAVAWTEIGPNIGLILGTKDGNLYVSKYAYCIPFFKTIFCCVFCISHFFS